MSTLERGIDGAVRARLALAAAALLAVAFYCGTLWPPLRPLYAPLCHQIAERSLSVGTGHQAVCARCAGLYLGGILALAVAGGAIARHSWAPRPRWLLAAAVPTALDALAGSAGLPSLPNGPRLGLAVPLGFVAGLFLAVGIAELARGRRSSPCAAAAAPTRAAQGGSTR